MSRIQKSLQGSLKLVLIGEYPIVYRFLQVLKTCYQIYSGLLVTRWWIFQVCQSALEFKRIIIVLEETCRNRRVERDASETFVGQTGLEDVRIYSDIY